jgi:hypothetical protein
VLSDHGQSQGRPFRQRYGLELADLVEGALASGNVYAPAPLDEGASSVGGALTDARDEDTTAGRMLARATRGQVVDGDVVIGQKEEAVEKTREDASEHTAVVLASGGLGLISLPERDHRLTIEEIEGLHPRLVGTLVEHPGIGFVMVRSTGDGALVLGAGGRRRLRDDDVTGRDPLIDFGPNAADHLRRTDGFAHCPDILVNCLYDSDANEVAPFEEFMGSHGGLGGWQSRPFALVPTEWSEPETPIVGVRAMHDTFRRWLAEAGLELRPHSTSRSD